MFRAFPILLGRPTPKIREPQGLLKHTSFGSAEMAQSCEKQAHLDIRCHHHKWLYEEGNAIFLMAQQRLQVIRIGSCDNLG
jgi:hypothetical protein